MENYCLNLNIFNTIKYNFFLVAFNYNKTMCSNNTIPAVYEATKLYNFTITNPNFIDEMKKGCEMGGNHTNCKIGKANVTDILSGFNYSYNNYIKHPEHLCTAFSEYANNEENLFITGGCYLFNPNSICNNSYIC